MPVSAQWRGALGRSFMQGSVRGWARRRGVIAACAASILASMPAAVPCAAASEPVADFALKALDGRNYRLSEYRSEVVALVFWASWCGGCRAEMQRFDTLHATYADAGLVVLGINVDDDRARAQAIAAATGTRYPQLLDADKRLGRAFGLERLPMAVLIDRNGVARFEYGELDARGERQMLGELRMLLDE